MAQDKKSFILYADLIHTIKKMPREKAGDLFVTILEYVNDENPEPSDLILQLTFEPIKQQLKRDLKAWELFKQKQRENGLKGGRPKKPNNPSLILETQKSLNVNVTVNDNVTVNVKERYLQFEKRILEDEALMQDIYMSSGRHLVTEENLKIFTASLSTKKEPHEEFFDYAEHYSNWLRKSNGGKKQLTEQKEHGRTRRIA